MQQDHDELAVQPLTHCNDEGVLYTRTPEVEHQIARALRLTPTEVITQAQHDDQDAGDYLREETIVYLIRAAHQRADRIMVDALFTVLLRRCERLFKRQLGSLGVQMFEDAYGDCVSALAERILDLDSDRGDFFQVRFWPALKRRAVSAFGRSAKGQQRTDYTVPLADEQQDDDDAVSQGTALTDATLSAIDRIEYHDGLNSIEEPYRTVFVLRYYHGWPTEDDDPTVPTISRYFNKTPRTIRNYLRRADDALVAWRGGH